MQKGRKTRAAYLLLVFVMSCSSNNVDHPATAIVVADRFLDTFYEFDQVALAALLEPGEDAERVLYYQAWAEAAHYQIKHRRPCSENVDGTIVCAITVTDDFGQALDYEATDTFTLKIQANKVTAVSFKGDDPLIFQELFAWISETRSEILAGPCKDLFDGGTTPAACSRAVAEAAGEFIKLRSR